MNIFASKEKYFGFDDRLMVIIGIPIVSILVDALLFGSPIKTMATGTFWKCLPIGLLFTSVLWISFREVMVFFVKTYPTDVEIRKRQILTVISLIIGFFIVDYIINVAILQFFFSTTEIEEPDFSIKIIVSLIFSFLIYAIYEGIYLTKNIGRKLIEKEEMIKENVKSQLAGLRAQINPHFLFNSLNTLSSLVHEDVQRADQFIGKLSKVYRYMLDQNEEQLVLLSEEMKYLDAYKHLLKERFEDSLIFIDHTNGQCLQKYIVPLSLQIVFENCVKHNSATKQKPLTIEINIDEKLDYIMISNNLQFINSHEESNGVGLENIKRRYACFTDKNILITNDNKVFKVSLPLLSDIKLKQSI